jgi:hypothetical protein
MTITWILDSLSKHFNLKTLQLFNISKKIKKVFDIKNNHPIFAVLKNIRKNNKAIQWQIINHH